MSTKYQFVVFYYYKGLFTSLLINSLLKTEEQLTHEYALSKRKVYSLIPKHTHTIPIHDV